MNTEIPKGRMMNVDVIELMEIKKLAMQYADPVRGKMLALVTQVELLTAENDLLQRKVKSLEAN
ncbi:hypothetical protein [Paenibacillus oryzisoli]|uniref:hypothetical protein n=1 Tax=Paenibacillus oryzisoli TaxID=1850517 RepID=UPI00195B2AE1|nr:hypothetical protein [Paenibacillus oryzisoli]